MYNSDNIRKHILKENRNKLFGEITIVFIMIIVIISAMYTARVEYPFKVISSRTDDILLEHYHEGARYIKIDSAQLNFTGYYKENKNGDIIYNCYKANFDELDYFVYVPIERSGKDPQNPDMTLKDYSFKARLDEDEELLELVAKDHDLSAKEFMKEYNVAPIVMNEAVSDHTSTIVLWIVLFIIIGLSYIYIVFCILKANNIMKRKEIIELGEEKDLNAILDKINVELAKEKEFDSNKIKITKHWFLAFYDGYIVIVPRDHIRYVEGKSRVKKAYGLINIGCVNIVEITREDDNVYEIPVDENGDFEEIIDILTEKSRIR